MVLLRSCIYFIWFALLTAVVVIALVPALLLPSSVMRLGARLWCKGQVWGLRVIARQRVEIRGAIPSGARIVASKHMSMLDTLVLYLNVPNTTFVLKRELAYIPFYGWYAWKVGFIFIDREGRASALRRLTARAQMSIAQGHNLVIFPEGTRKKPGAVPDYKSGVAALYRQLGVACVPVALDSGRFWIGPMGFLKQPGTVVVEFLDEIGVGLDRKAFVHTLEQQIESATQDLLRT